MTRVRSLLSLSVVLVLVACSDDATRRDATQADFAGMPSGVHAIIGKVQLSTQDMVQIHVIDPLNSPFTSAEQARWTRPASDVHFSGVEFRLTDGWSRTCLLQIEERGGSLRVENFGPTYKNKKRIAEIRAAGG